MPIGAKRPDCRRLAFRLPADRSPRNRHHLDHAKTQKAPASDGGLDHCGGADCYSAAIRSVYPGGLIAGALAMGAFWAYLAFRTCRIGWAIIGHISSNSIAFIGFSHRIDADRFDSWRTIAAFKIRQIEEQIGTAVGKDEKDALRRRLIDLVSTENE